MQFCSLSVVATRGLDARACDTLAWPRNAAARPGRVLVRAVKATAFGVFFWLEVLDFNLFLVFLFLVLHSVFLCWVIFCLCCVTDTEQQLMPACNVLFWNQVIQANQFIFPALGP